jgi:hypothetical protein
MKRIHADADADPDADPDSQHCSQYKCSQKHRYGIRRKNQFQIPDPGVTKAPDSGSESVTLFLMTFQPEL